MKLVHVIADKGHQDTLQGIAEQFEVLDAWSGAQTEEGRIVYHFLVGDESRQQVLDAVQRVLGTSADYHLVVQPVDAALPQADKRTAEAESRKRAGQSREELLAEIGKGARLDANYLALVLLSAVVAAVGLTENNVAVVVGAMVIAPLLGPNLALALGTTLGDAALIRQSLVTASVGVAVALALSSAMGYLFPIQWNTAELLARTHVNLAAVVLALASGAAAVVSLTSGAAVTLVGVMVAVALLPPIATVGIMLANGNWGLALDAAVLLAVNIVGVNLSAKAVFWYRGVKPRTTTERRRARWSSSIAFGVWVVALIALLDFLAAQGHASGQ